MPRTHEYDGLLGKTECEEGLAFLVDKAERQGICFTEVFTYPSEIAEQDDFTRSGLMIMLAWGLLECSYPTSEFVPSMRLLEIMRTRKRWKNLPAWKSMIDRVMKRFKTVDEEVKPDIEI